MTVWVVVNPQHLGTYDAVLHCSDKTLLLYTLDTSMLFANTAGHKQQTPVKAIIFEKATCRLSQ